VWESPQTKGVIPGWVALLRPDDVDDAATRVADREVRDAEAPRAFGEALNHGGSPGPHAASAGLVEV
jgi:hypothetical protein